MKNIASRTVIGLALVAPVAAAPLLFGGGAEARPDVRSGAGDRPTTVETQTGLVLECTGDHVQAFVYENSRHGNSVQVVMAARQGERIGFAEQAAPFVTGGALNAAVDVEGTQVTISGTVAPNGAPTKVVEPQQDGGEQIVTRGTNTPLATELVARWEHSEFPLTCSPAFAFELEVREAALPSS